MPSPVNSPSRHMSVPCFPVRCGCHLDVTMLRNGDCLNLQASVLKMRMSHLPYCTYYLSSAKRIQLCHEGGRRDIPGGA